MSNHPSSGYLTALEIRRTLVHILLLGAAVGVLIWHTLWWDRDAVQFDMLAWIGTPRVFLLILYNLALMIVSGTLLGLLLGKITALISHFLSRR